MVLVALTVAANSTKALAQEADQRPLQTFIQSDLHGKLLTQALSVLPPEVFPRCPSLVSKGSQVTMTGAVSFDPKGVPSSGRWKEAFPVSGCGNDTILNIYFLADNAKGVQVFSALPGETHAGPVLQRDAYTYASIGVSAKAGDCKSLLVTNTKFEGYVPGGTAQSQAWRETWTMAGCGKTYQALVNFTPDATGTQISVPGDGVIAR
jgi:hypothetical protein